MMSALTGSFARKENTTIKTALYLVILLLD